MDRQSPEEFLARHGEIVDPAKLEALNRQAEKFAREKANGGSHPQPDAFPKKAESTPPVSPDISETGPARGNFEHSVQIAQWPRPDLRIVEDGRAPSPTLDDDALPAGWSRRRVDFTASR
jgi:hypothetical protein